MPALYRLGQHPLPFADLIYLECWEPGVLKTADILTTSTTNGNGVPHRMAYKLMSFFPIGFHTRAHEMEKNCYD